MRLLLLPLVFLPHAFLIWCVVRYFRNKKPSLLYQWMRSIGWIGLCALPIVVVRFLPALFSDWDHLLESLAVSLGSWLVNLGGQSVIHIFEDNVKDWTGHRRDTMLDNADVFFTLTAVQVLILSAIVTTRFRLQKTWKDVLVLAVGVFVLVNAALGMNWMWYGT